ncbi:MAG: peptide chain release factor 2, partial [Chloroflexi bacterium]|nr:peptide chain release factor 2 [Chloroflexota bacterium]
MAADFWSDNRKARTVMSRLSYINNKINDLQTAEKSLLDVAELLCTDDADLYDELVKELNHVEEQIAALEFQQSFSGKYDESGAILAVHAGAGGVDSQDFASMLANMYLKWAELRGFSAQILDCSDGEEAGIKSLTMEIEGSYVYGHLKAERGTHRLVRLSPFDADHARHTSFAKVEITPLIDNDTEVTINPADVKIETFRSSGPGGQNVQKVSTAVRIIHIPTGIAVTSQTERSQLQNKESAFRILHGKLLAIALQQEAAEKARLKGQNVAAAWGNQIRSYVLHPYHMVKDHRTEYETSDTS